MRGRPAQNQAPVVVIWKASKHGRSKPKRKHETIVVETPASGSDTIYKTRFYPDSGKFTCTCPGAWRSFGNCKHIKKLRNEQKG